MIKPDQSVEDGVDLSGVPLDRVPAVLARAKTASVALAHPHRLVVGADTIVAYDGQILNKPENEEQALEFLQLLAGRVHQVRTGIVVQKGGRCQDWVETTQVHFRALTGAEMRAYVSSGEGFDKAGGYGIQGLGALLVEKIDGCYFNVVGLPLVALRNLFCHFGRDLLLETKPKEF